eukprot:gene5425-3910_t
MEPISPEDPNAVAFITSMAELATSNNADSRSSAEKQIAEYQMHVDQQLGFVPLLLTVAVAGLPCSTFASIVLKNTVKMGWNPANAEHCIQDYDKMFLREYIIREMLRATSQPVVQRNLAETISVMALVDFPALWPGALTTIIETLSSNFSVQIHSTALSTAHSILVRYRTQMERTDNPEEMFTELRAIDEAFITPFIGSMQQLLQAVQSPDCTNDLGQKGLEGLTAGVECLLDISQEDVGDVFLGSLEKVVHIFLQCLSMPGRTPLVVDLKSVVLSCTTLFLTKFDEDFEKYAGQFVKVVWDLIADPSSRDCSMDNLVVCGLELLSSACRGTTRNLFDTEEVLTMLLNQVALPNIFLSKEELELFELEPDMYIQRDVEGTDLHTRRRAASDIIRTLVIMFPARAKPLLLEGTKALFAAAATDWQAKDAAIFVASSLVLDGKRADAQRGTGQQQVSSIISLDTLIQGTILPELTSDSSAVSPLLIKADCLRFIATFRAQLDPTMFPQLLGVLIHWLQCESRIVSSYAAHALDKLLLMTVPGSPAAPPQLVVSADVLQLYIVPLLMHLCMKIQDASETHTYHALCLAHVLQHYPAVVQPSIADVTTRVNQALSWAIKQLPNPLFSHCLFDALSRCIALSSDVKGIENYLLHNLSQILVNDVAEYVPYALQLLSQLVGRQPPEAALPAFYCDILEPLLTPTMFSQKGTIPAAVSLLISYVERFPNFIHSRGATEKVLDVTRILVQLKNYDHEGLNLLTTVMLSYPANILEPYIGPIYQMLLQRFQTGKTPKFTRILILFFSASVVIRSAADLAERLEKIQTGLFSMVMNRLWLPNVQKILGGCERKLCVVALTNMMCECPLLHANSEMWSSCVQRCWAMIYHQADRDDHESFTPTVASPTQLPASNSESFSNLFLPLEAAKHPPVDVCRNISDPVNYFKSQLCSFLNGSGAALQSPTPNSRNTCYPVRADITFNLAHCWISITIHHAHSQLTGTYAAIAGLCSIYHIVARVAHADDRDMTHAHTICNAGAAGFGIHGKGGAGARGPRGRQSTLEESLQRAAGLPEGWFISDFVRVSLSCTARLRANHTPTKSGSGMKNKNEYYYYYYNSLSLIPRNPSLLRRLTTVKNDNKKTLFSAVGANNFFNDKKKAVADAGMRIRRNFLFPSFSLHL